MATALAEALTTSPVVAVTGPRTAGKSTLAREIVSGHNGTMLDLDDPAVRRLAAADPGAFVRGLPEPVVIDEFQRAPDVLGAIKAELNRDLRPGRYVLAGSARHQTVPELADFLTGRVELLTLWPFAVAELEAGASTIIDRLFDGTMLASRRATALSREDVVSLVLRGGYPIAVGLTPRGRQRWFANLATLVVERLDEGAGDRRAAQAGRFLRLLAARTAQVTTAAEVGREMELGRETAADLMRLLELVYLVVPLPAWSVNLSARVTKRPKLHLVDSGLAASLQGVDATGLSPVDPAAATRFGGLLETFVVTEILKQSGWADTPTEAFHLRTSDGLEVDLVLQTPAGRIAAVEIKAGSRVGSSATRGLTYLRDRLGDRFVAGVVLTTGDQAQQIGDRIAVAPVDSLWRA